MLVASRLAGRLAVRLLDFHRGEWPKYRHAEDVHESIHQPLEVQRERQLQRLRMIVELASRYTPFYRQRFQQIGFQPGDLRSFDDLRFLPPVTKADLIAADSKAVSTAPGLGHIIRTSTGGTTGQPLEFYRDIRCQLYRRGIDLALSRYYGWRDGEWQGWLWGAAVDAVHPSNLKTRLVQLLATRLYFADTTYLTDETYARFVRQTRAHRPTLVGAYATLAYDLAVRISEGRVPAVRVPLVVCSAEPLSETQRDTIERILADRCLSRYGAREFGTAGIECSERNGYHLFSESVYCEIEPVKGMPGEVGKLLVTDLRNTAMPLIRYDIGDLGRIDTTRCPCGLESPRLVDLRGRTIEVLQRPDGSCVHGSAVLDAVRHSRICAKIQVVQETIGQVIVNIAADPTEHAAQVASLKRLLRGLMGENTSVDLRRVETIRRSPSGKFPYIVSRLAAPGSSPEEAAEGPLGQ
ncbi:MAG: hypothetical protein RBT76_08445 [candidate division Zixibacteria bacterium]|jgi:phenylacetate-CoA ligase|nr:hypothetical protein [candidate division Zixibacteria bacterium]